MGPAIPDVIRPAAKPLPGGRVRTYLRPLLLLLGVSALGLFLSRAPLTLCLGLFSGAVGCFLLVLRPSIGLYALAFAIPFGSLWELHLGGVTVGTSELLVAGVITVWILRMMAFRRVRLARSRLTSAILLYLGTLVIAILPARDLTPAFKELAKWSEFLLLYLFVASEFGCAERRALTAALLLAGILEGALGIYQFLAQVGPPGFVLFGRYMRAHGTFLQPNPFGGYVGLLLPLAYATALTSWKEARTAWSRRNIWPALLGCLAVVATLVLFAALIMSWSRGALFGLIGGGVLVALALGRRIWLVVVILSLILLLLGPQLISAMPSMVTERLTDMIQYVGQDLTAVEITDENFSVIERLAHWYAAWRMFSDRPWLGVGTGQYATTYPTVALPRWQEPLGHAHNIYLNVLAEGGLLGLASYLIFLLGSLATAWLPTRRERGWRRGLALGNLRHQRPRPSHTIAYRPMGPGAGPREGETGVDVC